MDYYYRNRYFLKKYDNVYYYELKENDKLMEKKAKMSKIKITMLLQLKF